MAKGGDYCSLVFQDSMKLEIGVAKMTAGLWSFRPKRERKKNECLMERTDLGGLLFLNRCNTVGA